VQSYDHHFGPYAGSFTSGSGSPVVTAAKAAHDILVNRLPLQTAGFDASYATFLASLSPSPSPEDITNGEIAGATAAANVIAARAGDGSFPPLVHTIHGWDGSWRVAAKPWHAGNGVALGSRRAAVRVG